MLDGLTMDQLRTFLAAAETGSFSAAGRRLRRAQSVVSHTIANLEQQLDLALFDRSDRYPQLTEAGKALLVSARATTASMDAFKAHARTLAEGLEPELSVAVDVMFPIEALTRAVQAFHQAFPTIPLRLYVEALGAVLQPLLEGQCRIAIIGSLPDIPPDCHSQTLFSIPAVVVAAPDHPLAALPGPITREQASQHIQLVLTDRSTLTQGRDFGVLSPRQWRLADLGAKHAFLKAGLGWGAMPLPMVEEDLRHGRLVTLELEMDPLQGPGFTMRAVHRLAHPPGPAGRWLIGQLRQAHR